MIASDVWYKREHQAGIENKILIVRLGVPWPVIFGKNLVKIKLSSESNKLNMFGTVQDRKHHLDQLMGVVRKRTLARAVHIMQTYIAEIELLK